MKETLQNSIGMIWLVLFWPVLLGGIAWISLHSLVAFMIIFTILIVTELIISGTIITTLYD